MILGGDYLLTAISNRIEALWVLHAGNGSSHGALQFEFGNGRLLSEIEGGGDILAVSTFTEEVSVGGMTLPAPSEGSDVMHSDST